MFFLRRVAVLLILAVGTREARAQVSVSGSPGQMTVSAAAAGSQPLAVTNSLTTYTVAKPPSPHSYTITAQINLAMPPNVALTMTLASAGNGSSAGAKALTTSAQNMITGITAKVTRAAITYQLTATVLAGVVAVQSRTVTLTAVTVP
jgi:hypothetical protein